MQHRSRPACEALRWWTGRTILILAGMSAGWMSRTVWCRSKPLRLAGRSDHSGWSSWRRVGFARGGRGDEVDCLWSVPTVASRRRLRGRVSVVAAGSDRSQSLPAQRPGRSGAGRHSGAGRPARRLLDCPSGDTGSNFVNPRQPLWSSDSGPLRTRQPQN
jgi:hypothetical protein